MKFNKKQGGYSLPQMLTATAVGAVLTGVATTNYWSAVDKSRITAEMETIERIGEAVNVVLASDEGRTTYLTDEHRKLLQTLIPETGQEVTYAIRSTWKGTDAVDGNHQYALSLDIYPRYIRKDGSVGSIKSAVDSTVGNYKFISADPQLNSVPANVTGLTLDSDTTKLYVIAIKTTDNNKFVVLKLDGSRTNPVEVSATIDKSVVGPRFFDSYGVTYNSNGMQKIGLMAKALDAKMDGGDLGAAGSVQYDDTCSTDGIDKCYMHVYLVDKGLSYSESKTTGSDWHDEAFKSQMMALEPTSTILKAGQAQSTVILGKNGDS